MANTALLKVKDFLGFSGNGKSPATAEAQDTATVPIYQEWIPEELPDDYSEQTPTWLFFKLHYEVAAQKVFGLKPNTRLEAVKLGLIVVVIVVLLVFAIVVLGYGGG